MEQLIMNLTCVAMGCNTSKCPYADKKQCNALMSTYAMCDLMCGGVEVQQPTTKEVGL